MQCLLGTFVMLDAEHTLSSGLGCCFAQRCHKSSTVDPAAALRAPNVRCQQHQLPPHTHLVHVLLTARPARTQVGGYFGVDGKNLVSSKLSLDLSKELLRKSSKLSRF